MHKLRLEQIAAESNRRVLVTDRALTIDMESTAALGIVRGISTYGPEHRTSFQDVYTAAKNGASNLKVISIYDDDIPMVQGIFSNLGNSLTFWNFSLRGTILISNDASRETIYAPWPHFLKAGDRILLGSSHRPRYQITVE